MSVKLLCGWNMNEEWIYVNWPLRHTDVCVCVCIYICVCVKESKLLNIVSAISVKKKKAEKRIILVLPWILQYFQNFLQDSIFHFRAIPVAYGSFQTKGWIGAVTATIATPDLSCVCDLCCNLQQRQVLNSLSKARDQTCIFMDTMSGS